MLKFLRPFSELSSIAPDLTQITQIGDEADDAIAGLKPGSSEALWRCIENLYRTGVQPGIQLCVRQQGHVVLNRSIGHAQGNSPGEQGHNAQRLQLDTPINLFSSAKAVTAMLVHKMAEQGLIDLDDAVAAHLPGFERHGKHSITIRQVLTHRAGVARIGSFNPNDLDVLQDAQAIREMVLDLRPHSANGGKPAYHAITGGFILAELMREVTGRDPRALLQDWIKKPLGATWLDYGLPSEQVSRIAHNAITGLKLAPITWQLSRVVGASFEDAVARSNDPRFQSALIPSANVMSTAQDMTRFYQCLLDDGLWQGQRLFNTDTVQQAIQPDRPQHSLDRIIGIPIRYSPGFMLGHGGIGLFGLNQRDTFGHLGLSSTFTWARPSTGSVICLITTGKPVLGPHIPEMLAMFSAFNRFCSNRIVS